MIDTERDNDVLTIKVEGRVDGANANDFQQEIKDAVTDKDKVVLLDMQGLSYISSAGLRVVLMIAKTLEQQQAKFMIYSLSDSIREVFEISGFDKVINVHESREQALASAKG
ncbi:MAG: STAS domain-containing protein [Gammaproteobacteria bacterium]